MSRSRPWQWIVLSWIAWQVSFSALYWVAEAGGIGYRFSQAFWLILGVPNDLYGFRNLFFPRLVTFALISAPPTLFGLLVYERLARSTALFTLRELVGATAVMGGYLAIAAGDPIHDRHPAFRSVVFTALTISACAYLFRAVRHAQSDPALGVRCAYCHRGYKEAGPFAEGPGGVFICGRCVEQCSELIAKENERVKSMHPTKPPEGKPAG